MEIITGTTEFVLNHPTAVAIGKFDGVHLGHRRLIEEIKEAKMRAAIDMDIKTCIFTFDPAPSVFLGRTDGMELTTKEEKRFIFERMGIDILVEFPMNETTAAMPAEQFVTEVLCERMKTTFIAAGTDISFGDRGAGNAELLQKMSVDLCFELKLIDKIRLDGKIISSTYARRVVEQGNMEMAERLLGVSYFVMGRVVHGNEIGRTLGMPTANLVVPSNKLVPPKGVYLSTLELDGRSYKGISNIGMKPTIKESKKHLGVETYLYDFKEDIYDQDVVVSLHQFRRPERKFDSLDALKKQIENDIAGNSSAM